MYFELVKEVIKYILDTGYNKNNLQTLNIIKEKESITKDSLLLYMKYLFNFDGTFYDKLGLKELLSTCKIHYEIYEVKIHDNKPINRQVTIRKDDVTSKYIDKFLTYEDACAKVVWLTKERQRMLQYGNYGRDITYKIMAYMSYDASNMNYNLNDNLCLPEYVHVPNREEFNRLNNNE